MAVSVATHAAPSRAPAGSPSRQIGHQRAGQQPADPALGQLPRAAQPAQRQLETATRATRLIPEDAFVTSPGKAEVCRQMDRRCVWPAQHAGARLS